MRRSASIRLGPRFALWAMGASLPMAALAFWLIVTGTHGATTSTESELKGNAFQRPLEHLLATIPRRFIAVQTRGQDIGKIDAEIDQAFVDLDRVADRYGADLHFTAEGLEARNAPQLRISLVRDRWRALTSGALDPAGYDRITSDILQIISYAGQTSKLALDPDLDSASLIDVTLRVLPQMQLRLGAILREALRANQAGGVSSGANSGLQMVNLAFLKTGGMERVEGDLRVMLAEDANFYGMHVPLHVEVVEAWKHLAATIGAFTTLVERTDAVSTEELAKAGNEAALACHRFWELSSDQLTQLLAIRLKAQEARQRQGLVLTGAMVLLAAIIGGWFGKKFDRDYPNQARSSVEEKEMALGMGGDWTARGSRVQKRIGTETTPPLET